MNWTEAYPRDNQPWFNQIGQYIGTQFWDELNEHLQATYSVEPKIEYSICSGAPGWNVKYKKGGRSLCNAVNLSTNHNCIRKKWNIYGNCLLTKAKQHQ